MRLGKTWMFAAVAALLLAGSALAAEPAVNVGITTGSALRLRSEPSTSAGILTTMDKGVVVAVLSDIQDGWYPVSYSGRTGYVFGEYLDLIPDGVFTSYGQVSGDGVNVRTDASLEADVLQTLDKGTVVDVTGFCDGWYAVSCEDGTEGYIRSDFLNLTNSNAKVNAPVNASGNSIVDFAMQFLGTPYASGGASPSGFDCSGFTTYVFQNFGYTMPRSASSQWDNLGGTRIYNIWELQPGDLVYINDTSLSRGKSCSHAAIYVGDGKIIHSSSPRSGGVIISDLTSGYYHTYFKGGIRL